MKLNDKQKANFKLTDQGYLLAEGTKLARVGYMEYLGAELGKDPNKLYKVYVEPEDLFNDQAMASFNNMPSSIHHPEEMEINANNWDELAVGSITNIRPSEDRQFLLGDVLINSRKAITTIQDGMIEVSCGYDADIEEVDGKLKKVNIRGNHLAIVDEGRCGADCKLNLNDGKPKKMTQKKTTIADTLRKMFGLNKSVKIGDAKASLKKLSKKLNDASPELAQKFKDVEDIVVSPDATVEEKAAAVQELQTEAMDKLQEAQDAVAQAETLAAQIEEEAPTDAVVTDAAVVGVAAEADAKIADLEAQVQEKDAKIADLEAELAALKESEAASTAMNDAKTVFKKAKFADSMTSKEIKATAVASTGAYSFADAMKLQDCALNSAYAAAKTVAGSKSKVGANFVGNDAKVTPKIPKSLQKKGA